MTKIAIVIAFAVLWAGSLCAQTLEKEITERLRSIDKSIAEQEKKQQDVSRSLREALEKLQTDNNIEGASVEGFTATPRVYLHVKDNTPMNAIVKIRKQLENISISGEKVLMPSYQFEQLTTASNQLRYFNAEDKAGAEVIASQLTSLIPDLKVQDFRFYVQPNQVRPRYYEMWLKPTTTNQIAQAN
jgi:hypothetical protein